jgi:hypothetical protein
LDTNYLICRFLASDCNRSSSFGNREVKKMWPEWSQRVARRRRKHRSHGDAENELAPIHDALRAGLRPPLPAA